MKDVILKIKSNKKIARDIYKIVLQGDVKDIKRPGSFVQLKIDGFYLRRPISICDVNKNELTLIYKVLGHGTDQLTRMHDKIKVLTDLGNGFSTDESGKTNLLVGGGCGVPPLYLLAKHLIKQGKKVIVILAFNSKQDAFYMNEFKKLGARVIVTTVDGSLGKKGYATDAFKNLKYDYIYSCGPLPMLKAVYKNGATKGQYSLEERMGCGFGACVGCTIITKAGPLRVCKEGPVFKGDDILW